MHAHRTTRNFSQHIPAATPEMIVHGGDRLSTALAIAPISADAVVQLSAPRSVRRFSLNVRMDSGNLQTFTGWRVVYSNCFGPTKGGVRFARDTNENDLTTLAFRVLMKCAVNGLPHGGAGGGVAVDTASLSVREKEQLARAYVNALGAEVGPDIDILSPDIGTDATTMGWMADELNTMRCAVIPGAVNGKPAALGGIAGRPAATARGAWVVLSTVLQDRGIRPAGLTFAVQGYGSAGGHLARVLQHNGLRMVAASDSTGGLYAPDGLDAESLWNTKVNRGAFADLSAPRASVIPGRDVLGVPADIVIPAAAANQIDAEIASRLQCRMIMEIANAPVTGDAEKTLISRGIEIIPDVVVNAGGITMSHFEWVQNRGGAPWDADKAHSQLAARMTATATTLLQVSRDRKVSLAIAAQLMALERISAALCP